MAATVDQVSVTIDDSLYDIDGNFLASSLPITEVGQFFRTPDGNLVAFPVRNGARSGARADEGFEKASDTFRISEISSSTLTLADAQTAVASAWAAHSGDAIATLKAAIHSDLTSAGFVGRGGTILS